MGKELMEWVDHDYPPVEPEYMDMDDLPYPIVTTRCDHCPHLVHNGFCGKGVTLYGIETNCVCMGSSR